MRISASLLSTYNIPTMDIGAETKMINTHDYDSLRNADNHSDSSTEVGDWDTERDVQPRRRRKTIWRRIKGYRWILDTTLLLVAVGLLAERRWQR